MVHLVVVVAASAVVAGVVGAMGAVRRRRRTQTDLDVPVPERPLVRVLRNERELHEAAERAAQFEQMLVDTLRKRAHRYDALVSAATVTAFRHDRAVPVGTASRDGASRSA